MHIAPRSVIYSLPDNVTKCQCYTEKLMTSLLTITGPGISLCFLSIQKDKTEKMLHKFSIFFLKGWGEKTSSL